MIYEFKDGRRVDTSRDCSFEERNFLQKMLIYARMKMPREEFARRWRAEGNPVWRGQDTLSDPGPAARILLDLEAGLAAGR